MSSYDGKPWWETVSNQNAPQPPTEFTQGIIGAEQYNKQTGASKMLLGIVAGYLIGKAAFSRKWL